jgi:hypothetical protein
LGLPRARDAGFRAKVTAKIPEQAKLRNRRFWKHANGEPRGTVAWPHSISSSWFHAPKTFPTPAKGATAQHRPLDYLAKSVADRLNIGAVHFPTAFERVQGIFPSKIRMPANDHHRQR